MTEPRKYRKKPVVVEAMRFAPPVSKVLEWLSASETAGQRSWTVNEEGHLHLFTLEGIMQADPGDWIIKGIQGEFHPIKPGIFAETYEVADDGA